MPVIQRGSRSLAERLEDTEEDDEQAAVRRALRRIRDIEDASLITQTRPDRLTLDVCRRNYEAFLRVRQQMANVIWSGIDEGDLFMRAMDAFLARHQDGYTAKIRELEQGQRGSRPGNLMTTPPPAPRQMTMRPVFNYASDDETVAETPPVPEVATPAAPNPTLAAFDIESAWVTDAHHRQDREALNRIRQQQELLASFNTADQMIFRTNPVQNHAVPTPRPRRRT